jgi:hypothetical protein
MFDKHFLTFPKFLKNLLLLMYLMNHLNRDYLKYPMYLTYH